MNNPFLLTMVFELLKYVILFGGVFYLLRYYLEKTEKPAPVQPIRENGNSSVILPLRLQAYERFVLFLERIHPSNLVMRLNNQELTASQLQSLVVRTIREEFDYNLSQQLYISPGLWDLIRNAKEESIAMVNQATSELPENAMSGDLVKSIFSLALSRGKLPVEAALDEIKRELQRSFS